MENLKVIKTPKSYLAEQGEILEEATRGKLRWELKLVDKSRSNFFYEFRIIVPSLNNSPYTLLTMAMPIALYPVEITDFASDRSYTCENEAMFFQVLEMILSSTDVWNVIAVLLS